MAVQMYDVRSGADGRLRYIIHRAEDVTEFVRLRRHENALSQMNDEPNSRAGRMEAEIYRRAQELQSAHDFNNLLTIILSYSEEMLGTLAPGEQWRDEVEQIEYAGRRAAELTHHLLALSRQQVLQPRIVDVNEVLRGVGRLLDRVLGVDVELRISPVAQQNSTDDAMFHHGVLDSGLTFIQ